MGYKAAPVGYNAAPVGYNAAPVWFSVIFRDSGGVLLVTGGRGPDPLAAWEYCILAPGGVF